MSKVDKILDNLLAANRAANKKAFTLVNAKNKNLLKELAETIKSSAY